MGTTVDDTGDDTCLLEQLQMPEIVGLETPRPRLASPTVAAPALSRSTISRRIGWASAVNCRD